MNWQINLYSILALIGAFVVTSAAMAMRRQDDREASIIGVSLLLAAAIWLLANALELASTTLDIMVFWSRLQYIGVAMVPILWSIYIFLYTGARKWLWPGMLINGLIALVVIGLAFTNDYHGLLWTEASTVLYGTMLVLVKTRGPVFWIFISYGYLHVLVATGSLLLTVFRSHKLYRWQVTALIAAAILPLVGSIIEIFELGQFSQISPTSFSFAISGPIIAWLVPRLRLEDIVPVARDLVVESMSDAVIILDPLGRVADLNPAAVTLFGDHRTETRGRHLAEIWPEWKATRQASRQGDSVTQLAIETAGTTRHFDVRITPIHNWLEQLMSEVVVLRDITDRVVAEQALTVSRERYQLHFDNVSEVIYSIDRQFKVLDVSPSVEHYLGYTPEELIGKPIQEVNFLVPEYWEAAFVDIARVFSGETIDSSSVSVYEFLAKDGSRIVSEVSGAPLKRNGEIVAVVSVARDVTERVAAERAVKAALAEKEVMLKEIHHRVKNNLQVISSLLRLQSNNSRDEQLTNHLGESQRRVRAMALVHEKLYQSEDLAQIDFHGYLRSLLDDLTNSLGVEGVTIHVATENHEFLLPLDIAVPCGLIVNELVSNAFKHAFPDRKSGEVCVGLSKDNDTIRLTVSDNGCGFPQDFDFHKSKSLGLQLVNMLVRQLLGTLHLESEPDTSFIISFPFSHKPRN